MPLKEHLPPSLVVLARLIRTRLTLGGWLDRSEAVNRHEALNRLGRQPAHRDARARILVFSFRGWPAHAAWDAVLAHAIRLRGAAVHVFHCGGQLPICEVNFRHADPRVACRECRAYPDALAAGLSLDRSILRDYVSLAESAAIRRQVAALRADELETWCFDGQPIGELVRNSVLWFTRRSRIAFPRDEPVYRDFLSAGAEVARLAPRLFAKIAPTAVLEVNGLFFAEQILNRFAPPNCQVVTYEAGWRTNTLGFDRLSPRGFADLDAEWKTWQARPLTTSEERELDGWVDARAGGDMQRDFYVEFTRKQSDVLAGLGLDPTRPTAALFTNLVWDTAVLGRDRTFASITEWLDDTIDYFARKPHAQLVIRIHPAEDRRPSQESREKLSEYLSARAIPENVKIVGSGDRCNSYALLDSAAAVLVYTSTIGLEAALHRCPVIVAARVYYARRGFTMDPDTRIAYAQFLDELLVRPRHLTSVELDRARRFAYLLLFRFLRTIPVVRQRPNRLPLLSPDEATALLPGQTAQLDSLIDALIAGTPLLS